MALERKDRVQDTTTTTGTGTVSLGASSDAGFRTFVSAVTSGATVRYLIESADSSEWEVGEGVFTDATPDTLTRVTIYASSNSGNLVDFSAGTKKVHLVVTAQDIIGGNNSVVQNETPSGLINSSNTAYTLANTPVAGSLCVYLNGIRQQVTTHYTLSGTTLTMGTAPATGDILTVDYLVAGTVSGNADTVDNIHASASAVANKLLALDANANLPAPANAIHDSNGNEVVKAGVTASAVNEVTVTNAATGNSPEIAATGGDSNVNLKLSSKGSGAIDFTKVMTDFAAPTAKFANGFPGFFGFSQTFVNLTTTPVNILGATVVGHAMLFIGLQNIDGDKANFQINAAIEAGVIWRFNHVLGANCSITESSEGVFAITGLGDGRTYTLTLSTGAAQATLQASSLATGNTILTIFGIRFS